MLIVDVYNVLHITGVLPPELAGLDPFGLGELIGQSRYGGDEVLLVCDGTRAALDRAHGLGQGGAGPEERLPRGVRTVFAGLERSADDVIELELGRTARSKRAVVVSNDHRLRRAAGRAHARVLRSETFLHQLVLDRASFDRGVPVGRGGRRPVRPAFATDIPLDKASLQRWLTELEPEVLAAVGELAKAAMEGVRGVDESGEGAKVVRRAGDRGAARDEGLATREGRRGPVVVPGAGPISGRGRGVAATSKPADAGGKGDEREIPGEVRAWLLSQGIDPADLDMQRWLTDADKASAGGTARGAAHGGRVLGPRGGRRGR